MISIFHDQLSVWCKLICTLELFQIVVHLGWDVLDLLFSNNNYSDRNISVHSRWGSKAEKAIPVVNRSVVAGSGTVLVQGGENKSPWEWSFKKKNGGH